MKKRYTVVIFLLLLTLILTGTVAVFAHKLPERIRVMLEIQDYFVSDNLVFHVETADGTMDIPMTRQKILDDTYFRIQLGDVPVYYHDETVYLDNGRGYDLDEILPDLPDDPKEMLWLFMLAEVTWEDDVPVFTLTADAMNRILQDRPEAVPLRKYLSGCTLRVDDSLRLMIPEFGSVTIEKSDIPLDPIPTDLLMVMKAHNPEPVSTILPLVRACMKMAEENVFGAEAALKLECGPLPIQDSAMFYVTPDGLWLQRSGSSFAIVINDIVQSKQVFLGAGYLLCRDGIWEMDANGDSVCSLVLDNRAVSHFFSQALPEAAGLGIEFQQAKCAVTVSQDQIRRIRLSCSGEMPFLITQLPIAFSVDLVPVDGPIPLPNTQ